MGVGDDDAVEQVLAAQYLEGAFHVRRLAALVDGEIASYCDLYEDGPIAQVEALMTLEAIEAAASRAPSCRKRSTRLWRAAPSSSSSSRSPSDSPKELWAKLGFDVVGSIWWFQITPDGRLERELRRLLEETGATRVTLGSERPDDFYPVTHEALSPGGDSIETEPASTCGASRWRACSRRPASRSSSTTARPRSTIPSFSGCSRRTAGSPRRSSPRSSRAAAWSRSLPPPVR